VCSDRSLALDEVPQDVDSSYFSGSFSWPLLMLTGFFMFMAFALRRFIQDYEETAIIEYGKVKGKHAYSRLHGLDSLPVLGWSGLVYREPDDRVSSRVGVARTTTTGSSSQSTNIVAVMVSFAATRYFLLELTEILRPARKRRGRQSTATQMNNRPLSLLPWLWDSTSAHNGQMGY